MVPLSFAVRSNHGIVRRIDQMVMKYPDPLAPVSKDNGKLKPPDQEQAALDQKYSGLTGAPPKLFKVKSPRIHDRADVIFKTKSRRLKRKWKDRSGGKAWRLTLSITS